MQNLILKRDILLFLFRFKKNFLHLSLRKMNQILRSNQSHFLIHHQNHLALPPPHLCNERRLPGVFSDSLPNEIDLLIEKKFKLINKLKILIKKTLHEFSCSILTVLNASDRILLTMISKSSPFNAASRIASYAAKCAGRQKHKRHSNLNSE